MHSHRPQACTARCEPRRDPVAGFSKLTQPQGYEAVATLHRMECVYRRRACIHAVLSFCTRLLLPGRDNVQVLVRVRGRSTRIVLRIETLLLRDSTDACGSASEVAGTGSRRGLDSATPLPAGWTRGVGNPEETAPKWINWLRTPLQEVTRRNAAIRAAKVANLLALIPVGLGYGCIERSSFPAGRRRGGIVESVCPRPGRLSPFHRCPPRLAVLLRVAPVLERSLCRFPLGYRQIDTPDWHAFSLSTMLTPSRSSPRAVGTISSLGTPSSLGALSPAGAWHASFVPRIDSLLLGTLFCRDALHPFRAQTRSAHTRPFHRRPCHRLACWHAGVSPIVWHAFSPFHCPRR